MSTDNVELYKDPIAAIGSQEPSIHEPEKAPEAEPPFAEEPSELTRGNLLILLSAFCISFSTVGFNNAFGVFEEYYLETLPQNASAIAWIGSINVFFIFALGMFVGALIQKVHPRIIVAAGSVLLLLGVFLASISTKFWALILTQGVLVGIGESLMFSPALMTTTMAFTKRRGLALGLTVAGSSIGGIVWPIALGHLFHKVGFHWTMRIAGFMMMPLCVISVLAIHMPGPARPKPAPGTVPQKHPKPDFGTVFKTYNFMHYIVGAWFIYIGIFTGLFFVAAYGASRGLSQNLAFYLVTITNGASVFGRVLPGALADIWGPYNLFICAAISSGIVTMCLTAAKTAAGIIMFAIVYGFTSGAIISLLGACVAPVIPQHLYAPGLGCAMAILSTAGLIGNPVSGAVLDHSGYLALSMFSGGCLVFGGLIVIALRMKLSRKFLAKV